MENNFQYVDISRMKDFPKCAVMCRTEDEVKSLHFNMMQQVPECITWDLEWMLRLWRSHGGRTGFTLFVINIVPEHVTYCYEEWFWSNNYVIIEFSELADTKNIDESEMPLDVLFGY